MAQNRVNIDRLIFEHDCVEQKAFIYELGKREPTETYTRKGVVCWDNSSKKDAGHWVVITIDHLGNESRSCLFVGRNGWDKITGTKFDKEV